MIVKLATVFVLVGVCYSLPVQEATALDVVPQVGPIAQVPFEPSPVKLETLSKPPSPDNLDLKSDASTWWHSWYHHDEPVYPVYSVYPVYHVHSVPHYTYGQAHW